MSSPLASAPNIHDFSPAPSLAPASAPPRGRPSTCTPEKLTAMCALIRTTGVSDTAAGAAAGLSRAAVSRWKQDEDVEVALGQARVQYSLPRLSAIDETRLHDGRIDWRAKAWLIKFAHPEEYGRPSSRRRLEKVELPVEKEEARAATPMPEAGGEGESVTFRSEIPAGSVEKTEAGGENVAFRSEIPGALSVPAFMRPAEAPHITHEIVAFRSEMAAAPLEAGSVKPGEAPLIGRDFPTCAPGLTGAGSNSAVGTETGCGDPAEEKTIKFPETSAPAIQRRRSGRA